MILYKTLTEDYSFDIHVTDTYGYAPLHWHAKRGNYDLLEFLLEMGSYISLKTIYDTTCLNIAASNGHRNF